MKRTHVEVRDDDLVNDFRRVSKHQVVLYWHEGQLELIMSQTLEGGALLSTSLVHLDLSFNGALFGDKGAGMLAAGAATLQVEVLKECKALAHFDLGCNWVGANLKGATGLTGVIGECKAVRLGGNLIKNTGAPAAKLAQVRGVCKVLAHLDLGCNWVGADGAKRLAGMLGECKALAPLDLSENAIAAAGMEELAQTVWESARCWQATTAGVLPGECKALTHPDLRACKSPTKALRGLQLCLGSARR
eukprot:2046747-Rhodomonas_salina.1